MISDEIPTTDGEQNLRGYYNSRYGSYSSSYSGSYGYRPSYSSSRSSYNYNSYSYTPSYYYSPPFSRKVKNAVRDVGRAIGYAGGVVADNTDLNTTSSVDGNVGPFKVAGTVVQDNRSTTVQGGSITVDDKFGPYNVNASLSTDQGWNGQVSMNYTWGRP